MRKRKTHCSFACIATFSSYLFACGALVLLRNGDLELARFLGYPVLLANAAPVALGMLLCALLLVLGVDVPNSQFFWYWMASAALFVFPFWWWMEKSWRPYLAKKFTAERQPGMQDHRDDQIDRPGEES